MAHRRKPIGWLVGALRTPPIGIEARRHAGMLLRMLQEGEHLSFPESRPMPEVGPRIHELRVKDRENNLNWRILYRIDADAIFVIEWFAKKTRKMPKAVIDTCRARLERYDRASIETIKR
jgi:phage-related protein